MEERGAEQVDLRPIFHDSVLILIGLLMRPSGLYEPDADWIVPTLLVALARVAGF
jgi:hypothetical protein